MADPNPRPAPPLLLVLAAFLIVYVVWGSTYLAIRFAVETLPPFLMAGARFLLAGLILYGVMRRRVASPISPTHWRSAAVSGTLMLLGGNGLVCWAEQTVPSGVAALLIATSPLWFVFLDWAIFRGPRPGRAVLAGVGIGLVGIYLLVGPGRIGGEPVHLPGAVALLMACMFWALGSLYGRKASLPPNVFLSTAMQMIAAGVVLVGVGSAAGEWQRLDLAGSTLKSWLSVAYLVVFGSIVALSCYSWLLQVSTPARVSTYAYVNPVVAVLLGAALGDEALSPRVLLACVVIIVAVAIITTVSKRPAARPATPERESQLTSSDSR